MNMSDDEFLKESKCLQRKGRGYLGAYAKDSLYDPSTRLVCLSRGFPCCPTCLAVDWPVLIRLEWNFAFFPAISADCSVHIVLMVGFE